MACLSNSPFGTFASAWLVRSYDAGKGCCSLASSSSQHSSATEMKPKIAIVLGVCSETAAIVKERDAVEASKMVDHVSELVSTRVWEGAERFLKDYGALFPDDILVIVYSSDCRLFAAILAAHGRQFGCRVITIPMIPRVDSDLGSRLTEFLPSHNSLSGSRMLVVTLELNTMSHASVFRNAVSPYESDRLDVFRAINVSDQFFELAFNITALELGRINAGMIEWLNEAEILQIKTSSGSDLEVCLDPERFRWISNRGARRPNAFVVFPAGEVATYSDRVNGVFVADGAFNITAYTKMDARLENAPVTLEIEDSKLVNFFCDDEKVSKLLSRSFGYENADRIGEVGFGTNSGIGEFISMNSHLNERHPGVHLGFGQNNQLRAVVPYSSPIHLDMISSDSTLTSRRVTTRIDSQHLPKSDSAHPPGVYDEDIDGDCCGLFTH